MIKKIIEGMRLYAADVKPKREDHLAAQQAIALGVAMLLERTLPRKMTTLDRPALGEHVLIWRKGAEHWTLATANTNENHTGTRPLGQYFLLANTGDVRLQPEEIDYWMPQPPSQRHG